MHETRPLVRSCLTDQNFRRGSRNFGNFEMYPMYSWGNTVMWLCYFTMLLYHFIMLKKTLQVLNVPYKQSTVLQQHLQVSLLWFFVNISRNTGSKNTKKYSNLPNLKAVLLVSLKIRNIEWLMRNLQKTIFRYSMITKCHSIMSL